MADRQSYVLVGVAVFALALAVRAVPLYWSPLPATLDGLRYAALANDTLRTTGIPFSWIDADELVFTVGLSIASLVTGVTPLRLAQPFVVVTGAAAALVGVSFARRLGIARKWPSRQVRLAATLAGLTLAIEGLYVRRTGVPDEEALGLLLVPMIALAAHRLIATRRLGWGGITVALAVVFPPLHNLSSMIAAMTVTALVAIHIVRRPTWTTALLGSGLIGGFWFYLVGFFTVTELVGLHITYSGLFTDYPGLFFAWVIMMIGSVSWFVSTRDTVRRGIVLLPLLTAVGIAVTNAFAPIFPGTAHTSLVVVAMVLAYVVPIGLATIAAPALATDRSVGAPLLALVAAPVALVFYTLTATLTPLYFDAVMRIQTFMHVTVFVLAGIAAASIALSGSIMPSLSSGRSPPGVVSRSERWRSRATLWLFPVPFGSALGRIIVSALLISAVLTIPLAFINLDTVTYPSTVTQSEFQAATFSATYLDGTYATDHNQRTIAAYYYRTEAATMAPTRSWLRGGPQPACPVVSRRGWTRSGAHFYPAGPETIPLDAYRDWLAQRHLVYTATGFDSLAVTLPQKPNLSGSC